MLLSSLLYYRPNVGKYIFKSLFQHVSTFSYSFSVSPDLSSRPYVAPQWCKFHIKIHLCIYVCSHLDYQIILRFLVDSTLLKKILNFHMLCSKGAQILMINAQQASKLKRNPTGIVLLLPTGDSRVEKVTVLTFQVRAVFSWKA